MALVKNRDRLDANRICLGFLLVMQEQQLAMSLNIWRPPPLEAWGEFIAEAHLDLILGPMMSLGYEVYDRLS